MGGRVRLCFSWGVNELCKGWMEGMRAHAGCNDNQRVHYAVAGHGERSRCPPRRSSELSCLEHGRASTYQDEEEGIINRWAGMIREEYKTRQGPLISLDTHGGLLDLSVSRDALLSSPVPVRTPVHHKAPQGQPNEKYVFISSLSVQKEVGCSWILYIDMQAFYTK